jgi:hypothetical protein
LEDAVTADAVGQLEESLVVEISAGLSRIGEDTADGEGGDLAKGLGLAAAEKGGKGRLSFFLCHGRSSLSAVVPQVFPRFFADRLHYIGLFAW